MSLQASLHMCTIGVAFQGLNGLPCCHAQESVPFETRFVFSGLCLVATLAIPTPRSHPSGVSSARDHLTPQTTRSAGLRSG